MRRLLLATLLLILIGCTPAARPNYFLEMEELDEPLAVDVRIGFPAKRMWVTHQLILNDDETLFFAPATVRHDGNVYVNERDQYLKRGVGSFGNYNWIEVDDNYLKLIFE